MKLCNDERICGYRQRRKLWQGHVQTEKYAQMARYRKGSVWAHQMGQTHMRVGKRREHMTENGSDHCLSPTYLHYFFIFVKFSIIFIVLIKKSPFPYTVCIPARTCLIFFYISFPTIMATLYIFYYLYIYLATLKTLFWSF
jgi:cellulose synthase/poly-beta-1,6-N-acetylglucosamine synthase-like glycosyltransferase